MLQPTLFTSPRFGVVRTLSQEDKPLFCGYDVAKALNYARPSEAVRRHCKHTLKQRIPNMLGVVADILFIPEGDVYRLIIKSKMPEAAQFETWVFDEVLPSIRRNGGFATDEDYFLNRYLPYADERTKVMFRGMLETVRALNAKIEQEQPRVTLAQMVEDAVREIMQN